MPCFRPGACHCTDYQEQAVCAFFHEPDPGPSPQTQGPGPKPAEEFVAAPPVEGLRHDHANPGDPSPPDPRPGPKPAGESWLPPVETFPLADFDIAQRALKEIRGGLGFTRALIETMPPDPEFRLNTDAMRVAMKTIIARFEAAERACIQLGLPI